MRSIGTDKIDQVKRRKQNPHTHIHLQGMIPRAYNNFFYARHLKRE
jgi:hypothetical protein